MKIIKHPLKHLRRGSRANASQPDIRKPKKKALLIGICYDSGSKSGYFSKLKGPIKDVEGMKSLLTKYYDYDPKDIVILTDKADTTYSLRPTRAIILEQINKMVEGAEPGDNFFFHYSGHSIQIPNRRHSEEDDMDECIVPCDGEDMKITDNELRKRLVDSLPVGSALTAIFDSCHSESLLDLEHYHCNQVYVPWISKGRRKSDTMRSNNVRRLAQYNVEVSSRTVYQQKRVNSLTVALKRTSIDQVIHPTSKKERIFVKTKSLPLKSSFSALAIDDRIESPIFCDSPVALFPCDGFCRPDEVPDLKNVPDVISLSSCKDSQEAYESESGESMTIALIKILKNNPHPTLKDLMINLSHRIYAATVQIHKDNRAYSKSRKAWIKLTHRQPKYDPGPLDSANFQDPQMASHRPLDMEKRLWKP